MKWFGTILLVLAGSLFLLSAPPAGFAAAQLQETTFVVG